MNFQNIKIRSFVTLLSFFFGVQSFTYSQFNVNLDLDAGASFLGQHHYLDPTFEGNLFIPAPTLQMGINIKEKINNNWSFFSGIYFSHIREVYEYNRVIEEQFCCGTPECAAGGSYCSLVGVTLSVKSKVNVTSINLPIGIMFKIKSYEIGFAISGRKTLYSAKNEEGISEYLKLYYRSGSTTDSFGNSTNPLGIKNYDVAFNLSFSKKLTPNTSINLKYYNGIFNAFLPVNPLKEGAIYQLTIGVSRMLYGNSPKKWNPIEDKGAYLRDSIQAMKAISVGEG